MQNIQKLFEHQKLFGHIIKVHAGKYPNSDIIEVYKWEGYKFEQFIKWQWYFEYRAALLRVKYPKNHIDSRQFDEPLTKKTEMEILKSKISSKKRLLTKVANAISKEKQNWNQLFPIEEDVFFQKALIKKNRLEEELKELESFYLEKPYAGFGFDENGDTAIEFHS